MLFSVEPKAGTATDGLEKIFRSTGIAVLLFLFASVSTGLGEFGDPRGYLANEHVTETVLFPGVKLFRVDGLEGGAQQVTHVVTVDLSVPRLGLKALPGDRVVNVQAGQFFRKSYVSQLQADNNVLAAINTAFFDIGATQAPLGLFVKEGNLLREPQAPFDSLVFTADRVPVMASFGFSGEVRHAGLSGNLSGVNRPNLKESELVLYQQPWDGSPGTSAAFTSGELVTEVVVQRSGFEQAEDPGGFSTLRGTVVEVRNDRESTPIADDQFVISAVGANRLFLQAMIVGTEVEARWQLTGGPASVDWSAIDEGVAGNNVLIINGVRQNGGGAHWDNRHPRSAIGINEDGSRFALLMVEGRQELRAAGMSLHAVAAYLEHMGAHNALEFDGGGSSALAARVGGEDRLVSTQPTGVERYVPAGLGVHADEEENPFFQDVRVTAGDDGAVISWTTSEAVISHARYGTWELDRESVPAASSGTRHTALLENLLPSRPHFARLVAEMGGGEETSHLLSFFPGVEVVVDNPEAVFEPDDWDTGMFAVPYGENYRYAFVNAETVDYEATYQPEIPRSGAYDLYAWFVHGTNRTPNARYRIHHSEGVREAAIDQTSGGSQWRLLSSDLHFDAGSDGRLVVINADGIGEGKVIMADAFRWSLQAPDPLEAGVLPDWWTEHFFGAEPPASDVDTDGDGLDLWREYLWATDPTDSLSRVRFRLEREEDEDGFRIVFSPFHGEREYRLYGRSDLGEGDWELLEIPPPVANANGGGVFHFTDGSPRGFYRLNVSKP